MGNITETSVFENINQFDTSLNETIYNSSYMIGVSEVGPNVREITLLTLLDEGGALTNNNSVGGHNFMEALNSCNNESIVCTGSYLGNNLESVIEILKKYNCKVPYKIKSNDDYAASLEEIYDIAQKKQASSLMKKMVNIEASSNSANVNAFPNFKMKLIDEIINDLKMNGVISTRRI